MAEKEKTVEVDAEKMNEEEVKKEKEKRNGNGKSKPGPDSTTGKKVIGLGAWIKAVNAAKHGDTVRLKKMMAEAGIAHAEQLREYMTGIAKEVQTWATEKITSKFIDWMSGEKEEKK